MKLTATKESIERLETIEHPGADEILAVMFNLIDDVYEATGSGLGSMKLVTESGAEEEFLDALDNVTMEINKIFANMDPEKMPEELQYYAGYVKTREGMLQKVNEQVKQWKETAEQCKNVKIQLDKETAELKKKAEELNKLQEEENALKQQMEMLCLTEEGCQKRIARLNKTLEEIPQSETLTNMRNEVAELQKKTEVFASLLNHALENQKEDAEWKECKFSLVEEKFRSEMETAGKIVDGWESHLKEIILFAESLEAKKENEYAGS